MPKSLTSRYNLKFNKMKTKHLSTALIILIMGLLSNNVYAQGAYVTIHGGYGLGVNTQNGELLGLSNTVRSNNSITYNKASYSLGKGLNFGGALGYMFNKNIGAELGISYLIGGKSTGQDTYTNGETDYTISGKMLRITPSIVISSGFEGTEPYAKFGMVIGSGSVIYEYNDNDDGDIDYEKIKLNEGLSFGISSTIGSVFKLNDKMSFFGELNMISLQYSPKKGEIIEATYNGTDVLPSLTTSEKEIEFVDSYTFNYASPPPDSQPDKEVKFKMPFGSFGLNFGVRIGF